MLRRNFFSLFGLPIFSSWFPKQAIATPEIAVEAIQIIKFRGKTYHIQDNTFICIETDIVKKWYNKEGKIHRDNDLPAVESPNGDKYWCQNGKYHRDNDLPAVEHANGDKQWWKNGECHRDNGPAIEYINGEKYWYQNGHRVRI